MIDKSLFLILFLTIGVSSFTQELYPVAKDGKWGLMDEQNEFVLETNYDFIRYHYFGEKFVYNLRGKRGVLNKDGSVFSPPIYQAIYFYSPELVISKLDGKWKFNQNGIDIDSIGYDTTYQITKELYLLARKDHNKLYNTTSKSFSEAIYTGAKFDHGFLVANRAGSTNIDVLDPQDLSLLAVDAVDFEWWSYPYGVLKFKEGLQIVNQKTNTFESDVYASVTHEFFSWYLCKTGTDATLLNLKTKESYPITSVDFVLDIQGSYMVYKNKKTTGVWNYKTNEEVFPAKYEGLALKGNSIFLYENGLYGLANISGKVIFEPKYSTLLKYDNLYVVGQNKLLGIASSSGKIIEPIQHKEIDVFDNNVKCYTKKKLVTLNISSAGKIVDRTEYSDYMRVNFMKAIMPRQNAKSLKFDGQNKSGESTKKQNEKGWFQIEMQRVKEDTVVTVLGKWGLKDENDSLWIPHMYFEIDTDNSTYTKGYKRRPLRTLSRNKDYSKATNHGHIYTISHLFKRQKEAVVSVAYSFGFYELIHQDLKQRLSKDKYQQIHLEDFNKYALARAVQKNAMLIDEMGFVKYDSLTYYSKYRDERILICQGGKQIPSKSKASSALSIRSFFWHMGFFDVKINRDYPNYFINGGSWYFVDKEGKQLNGEPFQYAYEFVQQASIVKQKGKWGVVDTAMNIIVPIIYQSVERVFVGNQAFFRVKTSENQKYLYDRANGTYEPTDIKELSNYSNGLWLVKDPAKSGKYGLLDTNLNLVVDYTIDRNISNNGNSRTVSIDDKPVIIDKNGKKLHTNLKKATNVIPLGHGRYKVIVNQYNFHVVDKNGNTIIAPYKCSKIMRSNEKYIFYKDMNFKMQIWSEKKVKLPKKTELLSGDPETEILLLKKGKKQLLYDLKTGEYISKSRPEIISLEKEGYIFQNAKKLKGMVSYSGDTLIMPIYQDIEFDDSKSWGIAKPSWNEKLLIDYKGKKIFEEVFYSIENFGKYYRVKNSKGVGLITKDAKVFIACQYRNIDHYMGDFYMAHDSSTNDIYLDENGVEMCRRPRLTSGFPCNGLVEQLKKYHYFSTGYLNYHFRFNSITPLANDRFIVQIKNLYGIYNSEGEIIVTPDHHAIWQDRDRFKVRYFNSYGYIDQFGQVIFNPKTGK